MLGAPMFQSSTPMQPATPAVVRRVACHQCGWLGTLDVTATSAGNVGVEPGRSLPANCWRSPVSIWRADCSRLWTIRALFILPRRMASHARPHQPDVWRGRGRQSMSTCATDRCHASQPLDRGRERFVLGDRTARGSGARRHHFRTVRALTRRANEVATLVAHRLSNRVKADNHQKNGRACLVHVDVPGPRVRLCDNSASVTTKDILHALVDELDESEAEEVLDYLKARSELSRVVSQAYIDESQAAYDEAFAADAV